MKYLASIAAFIAAGPALAHSESIAHMHPHGGGVAVIALTAALGGWVLLRRH